MSLLSKVAGLLGKDEAGKAASAQQDDNLGGEQPEASPPLPTPMLAYVLSPRRDGLYDILDGTVAVGSLVQEQGDGEGPATWMANVRDTDARFGTLEAAKAWLSAETRKLP